MEYLFLIILYALILFLMLLTCIFGPETTSAIVFIGPLVIIYGGVFLIFLITIISSTFSLLMEMLYLL